MNKKEKIPTIPPNLYPTPPFSVGSNKVDFFVCFRLSLVFYSLSLLYSHSHLFQLFTAVIFLILLISFKNFLRGKDFLALYTCNLSKGRMKFSWYFLIS